MKKVLLSMMVMFAFTFATVAQTIDAPVIKPVGEKVDITDLQKSFRAKQMQNKEEIGWFIPAWDLLDNYYLSTDDVTHYANLMFPDSTVIYESGSNWQYNWVHGIGGTLDPYALIFDPNLATPVITPGTPYVIDSIFMIAWYRKFVNVTDTLLIEFVHGTPQTAPVFGNIQYTSNQFPLSPPSMTYANTHFGQAGYMTPTNKTVIKHVLTDMDTTMMNGKYLEFPVGLSVPANEIVGVHISFIPGNTYSFGDSLYSYTGGLIANPNLNAFRFGFYSKNDDPTLPALYFADNATMFGWNLSYYVPTETRYQLQNPTFLNEMLYPLSNWGLDLGYKVSVNTGINEPGQSADMKLYPNPSNGVVTVELSSAVDAEISIYDITGQVVLSSELNSMTSTLDLSHLDKGYYLVKLSQNGQSVTRKLVLN